MAVDGIGKGGASPPASVEQAQKAGSPERASVEEPFAVEQAGGTGRPEGSPALDQLRRGEITFDQYLDIRVDSAVEHLVTRLSPPEVDFVKQVLRDQLTTDPVLTELLNRATAGDAG